MMVSSTVWRPCMLRISEWDFKSFESRVYLTMQHDYNLVMIIIIGYNVNHIMDGYISRSICIITKARQKRLLIFSILYWRLTLWLTETWYWLNVSILEKSHKLITTDSQEIIWIMIWKYSDYISRRRKPRRGENRKEKRVESKWNELSWIETSWVEF